MSFVLFFTSTELRNNPALDCITQNTTACIERRRSPGRPDDKRVSPRTGWMVGTRLVCVVMSRSIVYHTSEPSTVKLLAKVPDVA